MDTRSDSIFGSEVVSCMQGTKYVDDWYNMDHLKRGLAVVIYCKQRSRDFEAMKHMLQYLGFKVQVQRWDALTFKRELRNVSQEDHADNDCFVCVLLLDEYASTFLDKEHNDHPFHYFNSTRCPSLAGKPKLFFVDACRGQEKGIEVTAADAGIRYFLETFMPSEEDFCIAYAVASEWDSSSQSHDSWFPGALVEVIKENWRKTDLLSMLAKVNKKVVEDHCEDKQMPCIKSTLTKKLFFTEKNNAATVQ